MNNSENNAHPEILAHVRPRQLQRLCWIETALRRSENIPCADYCDFYRVSQPTFTHDLDRFSELVHIFGGMSKREKGWLEVLQWPTKGLCGFHDALTWHKIRSPQTVVQVVGAQIAREAPEVCEAASMAILKGSTISASYISTTSGEREIQISPHSLVNACGRHHVRAFDHQKNSFRDFVLARMSDVKNLENVEYISSDQDNDWHSFVDVELSVSTNFSDHKRGAIALGFGLAGPDAKMVLSCRRCLVDYELLSIGVRSELFEDYLVPTVSDLQS